VTPATPATPSAEDQVTGDYPPVQNPAKFYFCETCGKRITDIDIDRGAGRDKKLKGVYCKACAVGVMTVEFDAIKGPEHSTPATPASRREASESPKKGSAVGIAPASRPAGNASDRPNVRASAQQNKQPRSSARNAIPPVAIAIGVAAIVGLVVLVAAFSSSNDHKERVASKVADAPAKDSSRQSPLPSAPKELPVPAPVAPRPDVPPPEAAQKPDPEVAAKADYNQLVKFEGLTEENIEGRMASVEAFLAKHGDSVYADPARALLSALKKQLPKPAVLTPAAPPLQQVTMPTPEPLTKPAPSPQPQPQAKPAPAEPAATDKADPNRLKQFADILKQLSPLLRQNQLGAAEKLLDDKLRDPANAALTEMLKKEKSDLSVLRILRQRAIDGLCSKNGSTVSVTLRGAKITGTVKAPEDHNQNSVALAMRDGLEMTMTADLLTAQDVDAFAPAETGDAKAEDLRRRGLLFLAAGDSAKAADYFTRARDAGLADAVAPYFERIAEHKLAEKEIARDEAWKKAEAFFANKNMKDAKIAYETFQRDYPESPAYSELLKKRMEAIEEAQGPRKSIDFDLGSGVKMELVLIQSGEFEMGSNDGDPSEKPVHKVKISKSFYIGKFDVTQAQYEKVMRKNPSQFKGDSLPVESLTYADAEEFCKKASKLAGRPMTLPTEAEWEYACRAGTKTMYNTGDTVAALDQAAWYKSNSEDKTHPVGQKKPNLWGLYDMHGNVWQWCRDWYADDYYSKSPAADPDGPAQGTARVLRGGSWNDDAGCKSARRYKTSPGDHNGLFGFRVVMAASGTP
jgi:formylglycine-generating enzyme required for sulfatase activity